jgi:hypothetical protein
MKAQKYKVSHPNLNSLEAKEIFDPGMQILKPFSSQHGVITLQFILLPEHKVHHLRRKFRPRPGELGDPGLCTFLEVGVGGSKSNNS